jgi:hypothetical protein
MPVLHELNAISGAAAAGGGNPAVPTEIVLRLFSIHPPVNCQKWSFVVLLLLLGSGANPCLSPCPLQLMLPGASCVK